MRILAIETSCDETAVAILECSGPVEQPSVTAISQALYSQTAEHAPFGGVFPALAKREHIKNLVPLTLKALNDAGVTYDQQQMADDSLHATQDTLREILSHENTLAADTIEHILPLGTPHIDAIAVTRGPGLEPALWVGLNFAKALSYAWNIPIIPTNHMEGHIASVLVNGGNPKPKAPNTKPEDLSAVSCEPSAMCYPALALLVSGGHTELVKIDAPLSYKRIGETRDDAVGEAYDKVARLLGLPYPGGPQISKLAAQVRATRSTPGSPQSAFTFPRPMITSDNYDFSYAGLKTAVLYKTRELGELSQKLKETIAYEFEEAAVDVLISKTKKALQNFGAQTLIVGGGVIANMYLRERLEKLADEEGITLILPTRELSTDNALMIGAAAYMHIANEEMFAPYNPSTELTADGTLKL